MKTNPLAHGDLDEFVACFNAANRHAHKATWEAQTNPDGRWRAFGYEELLARDNDPRAMVPEWHIVDGAGGFILSMLNTMQNLRDTQQARLPGYRERVVQMRLSPHQGGLSLVIKPRAPASRSPT